MAVVDDSAAMQRGSAEEPEHSRMVAGVQRMSLAGGFGYHQQHQQQHLQQRIAPPTGAVKGMCITLSYLHVLPSSLLFVPSFYCISARQSNR